MDDPLNTPDVPPSADAQNSEHSTELIAESFPNVVIQNGAKNPSFGQIEEKREFSANSVPQITEGVLRERNDEALVYSEGSENAPDNFQGLQSFVGGSTESSPAGEPALSGTGAAVLHDVPNDSSRDDVATWRRGFRHNLSLLLTLTLVAFTLTTWVLIRVDSPFGIFSTGPQEIVRAQLRAVDRGELRPAYDMFSARYRGQVSYDDWHELIVTHWRMFHAEVEGSRAATIAGAGVTLEIYLHGADDKDYRARFTLIRTAGRWWIDDVHWAEEPDERGVSRT